MTKRKELTTAALFIFASLAPLSSNANAAQCGSGPGGFESWKRAFAEEARAKGIGASGVSALMGTNYASATISADRGQRSFSLSLDQFLAERGASALVRHRGGPRQSQAAKFASIAHRQGLA